MSVGYTIFCEMLVKKVKNMKECKSLNPRQRRKVNFITSKLFASIMDLYIHIDLLISLPTFAVQKNTWNRSVTWLRILTATIL